MRSLFEYDPNFGRRFIPNIKARVEHESGGYLIRTNSSGFRCKNEFSKSKTAGRFRVAIFGDSFTAGSGVSDQYRFGDLLEDWIPDLEVFNFGMDNTGTDQQYLIYHELMSNIECDLIVIAPWVENIRRNLEKARSWSTQDGESLFYAKPYFSIDADGLLNLHNIPVPEDPISEVAIFREERPRSDRLKIFIRTKLKEINPNALMWLRKFLGKKVLPEYSTERHPAWILMKAILIRWIEESHVPVLIFPIPLEEHCVGSASPIAYQERFKELSDPPLVHVHDPLPDMLSYPFEKRRRFWHKNDRHCAREGHEALARSLEPAIRRLSEAQKL